MPLEQLLDTLPPEILGTPPELPSTEVKVDIEGTLTPAESEGEEEAMEVERVKGGVASETIKEECPPIDQGAGKIILEDPRLKGRRKRCVEYYPDHLWQVGNHVRILVCILSGY